MSNWNWPGARWWKFDFHTHTPASIEGTTQPWQQARGTPDEVTCQRWLQQYMAAEIDCVAVTDHNTGAWIDSLKAAYADLQAAQDRPAWFRAMTIFPGVEISVVGGLHILALFDPSKSGDTITALLGAVGFPDYLRGKTDAADGAACSVKGLKEVIAAIREAGGLIIPAHADLEKGLFTQSNQDALKHALEVGVDAVEIIDPTASRPQLYQIRNPDWAEVVGSDCHSFRGEAVPGSRYTWIKMAHPTIDGLRLALHDGNGFSVRRHDAGPFSPHVFHAPCIRSVTIGNFQVMGNGQPLTLNFNPFFNAVIGGRGTGKSTLVHALRLAYRREGELRSLPETSVACVTFDRFATVPSAKSAQAGGGLRDTSSIQVVLLREGHYYCLTWQQDGNGCTVQEWDAQTNAWVPSSSQMVNAHRFPIRIFSQGQIADLAGDKQQALLDIIDEAAGIGQEKEAWKEAQRSYHAQRAKIREFDGRLAKREELQVRYDDIARKLATLEGSDHASILKRYQISRQQDHEVNHCFQVADDLRAGLGAMVQQLAMDDIRREHFDDQIDADVLASIDQLNHAVAAAQRLVHQAEQDLQRQIEQQRTSLGLVAWRRRVEDAHASYDQLQSALMQQGISDLSSYGQLVQQRQALTQQLQQLDALAVEKEALAVTAAEQLQCVYAARAAMTHKRRAFLRAQLVDNRYIRISVRSGAEDTAAAEHRLRELIEVPDTRFAGDIYDNDGDTGLLADWERSENRLAAEAVVRDVLVQAATGERNLGGAICNNLEGRASRDPAFIDRIRCLSFEDGLTVEVSRTGDGRDFQPVGQASAGQRSAAMLAFLLSYGDDPIVLDQPEDDLDNHMIYDLIVRQIRDNKQRRQLIVITHNPNIVVNGDAELIHALDFRGGQCQATHSGALQDEQVRSEVCTIMEGGEAAFRRRWQRLRLGKEQ